MESNFDFDWAIENLICGQKRTGRAKQFVFLNANEVIKGPYSSLESGRLKSLISRSLILIQWKNPSIVLPVMENGDIKILKGISKSNDNKFLGYFICFPNLNRGYDEDFEMHTDSFKFLIPINGKECLTYKILKRSQLIKLNHAFQMNLEWIYSEETIKPLIEALLMIFVLGVGDTGPSNILADLEKKKLFLIDFEDTRGNQNNSELFYFTKDPASQYSDKWKMYIRPFYPYFIEFLSSLDLTIIDKEILSSCSDRKNFAISQFQKLSLSDLNPKNSELGTDLKKKNKKILSKKIKVDKVEDIQKSENTMDILCPVDGSKILDEGSELIVREDENDKIGLMKFAGIFGGSTGVSGYTLDILKSALQKYIRRDVPSKALLSAIELYRMMECEKAVEAIRSNMYNRLAVIAVEDICVANLDLVISVLDLVMDKNRDITLLATMVKLMANSHKTRIGSHAHRVFGIKERREIAIRKGVKVDLDFSDEDIQYLKNLYESGKSRWTDKDPLEIRPYLDLFEERLRKLDWNAITWLNYYQQACKSIDKCKVGRRQNKSVPEILIWEVLKDCAKKNQQYIIGVLQKAYFTFSEKRPFLMCAVLTILYQCHSESSIDLYDEAYKLFDRNEVEFQNALDRYKKGEEFEMKEETQFLCELMDGKYRLKVDDFCIDKHTKAGKARGADRKEFTEIGAQVCPLSLKYHIPLFEEIYNTN